MDYNRVDEIISLLAVCSGQRCSRKMYFDSLVEAIELYRLTPDDRVFDADNQRDRLCMTIHGTLWGQRELLKRSQIAQVENSLINLIVARDLAVTPEVLHSDIAFLTGWTGKFSWIPSRLAGSPALLEYIKFALTELFTAPVEQSICLRAFMGVQQVGSEWECGGQLRLLCSLSADRYDRIVKPKEHIFIAEITSLLE